MIVKDRERLQASEKTDQTAGMRRLICLSGRSGSLVTNTVSRLVFYMIVLLGQKLPLIPYIVYTFLQLF